MSVSSVKEYVDSLEDIGREAVLDFLEYMKQNHPNIKQKVSYSMPMWFIGEKFNEGYIGISVAKKHFSIHFGDDDFVPEVKIELPECKFGKRCINIEYEDTRSYDKVKTIVDKYINSFI